VLEARGWTPARPEDFQRQIWQPLRIDPVEREPDLAYRRTREPAAMLKLDLQGLPPAASGEQALNWQVGPGKADLHATASWSEPPASGPVEWEVPNGVTLTDVRGEGLRSWSRSGSLLQAWFESRSAGRPVVLTLTGSVLRPTEDTAPEKTPFAPPALRQLGVGRTWTQLTVQPREGWRLRIENEGAYKSFPTTDLPGSRWTGFTDAAPGQPVFVIYPARGKFSGDILTTVEASGRQFAWTSAIDVEAAANPSVGPVHTLVIDVRRAEGDRPQLTLPPGTRLRETRPALRGVTWVVDCLPGRRRLTIAGKMATAAGEPTEAPHVAAHAAGEPGSLRRWLALGRGVQPQRAAGLQPAPIPAGLEPRTAGGWTVAADNWSLVMSAPGGAGPENANASVVDVESASSGAGRWLNRATLVVVTDARAPWTVRPPNQAELLSGEVDDRDLPGPDAAAPLTLPIQAPGLHVLRLVWRASTSSTRLPLELPRLEIGGEALPVTGASWTVLVPGGQRVAAGPAPIDYARAELQRAADLLDLSHRAGSRLRGDSQSRLAGLVQHSLRRAELALAGPASAELGPDGRTLGEWLKQLRDAAPPAAEPKTNEPPAPFGAAFDRGTPYHWHAANSDAPNIHLEDADNDFSARALGSIALTALVAIGFFVSGLRRWSHAD
jgi:cell wall-associated NlpC family hydrolase